MTFWRLTEPRYARGDYEHTFVNGHLEHPVGLPGVRCDVCGATWGGHRPLPFALPRGLDGELPNERGPIELAAHRALRTRIEAALALEGRHVTLSPGDRFQPARARIPTYPEADFLWPGLGVIVSQRVRDLLADRRGVELCEVIWDGIGSRSANSAVPIPDDGEPESLLSGVSGYDGRRPVPRYFEVVVTGSSKALPGAVLRGTCAGCGREDLDKTDAVYDVRPEDWNGDDIFYLHATLFTIVTERLANAFVDARCTNVELEPLPFTMRW